MNAHRTEAVIGADGSLALNALPFLAGQVVEVIVVEREWRLPCKDDYSLRGTPVTLHEPFEPVAEGEWDTAP